jgi:hypothetical protein
MKWRERERLKKRGRKRSYPSSHFILPMEVLGLRYLLVQGKLIREGI